MDFTLNCNFDYRLTYLRSTIYRDEEV